jgi:hypothetical protein
MLYGAAVGLATGAWMFAEYALGLHKPDSIGRWTGFVSLIFPVLGAYLLSRHEPQPSWIAALKAGAIFGGIGGLIGAAAIYAYHTWINPNFRANGVPVDPHAQSLIGLVGALVLGVLLVPGMRAMLRRRGVSGGAV